MKEKPILQVSGLKKWFPLSGGILERLTSKERYVKAVDGISFEVEEEEIFGLIGESGCGKTTTGRVIARLAEPTSGNVYFEGKDILSIKGRKESKEFHRKVQMVFQDPYESLPPRSTILTIVSEPLIIHDETRSKAERKEPAKQILNTVGLPSTREFLGKRPPQLSGGQRQRVAIARHLILHPKFLVVDEPVSMLDASMKGSIINLLLDIRKNHHVTFIMITHDISIAWHLCDRIAVMYLGEIVESAKTETIIQNPVHPYSKALISAVPTVDYSTKCYLGIDKKIHGIIPPAFSPPSGCRFHPRCPYAMDVCSKKEPETVELKNGHKVVCHFAHKFS